MTDKYFLLDMAIESGIKNFVKNEENRKFVQNKLNDMYRKGYILKHVYDFQLYLFEFEDRIDISKIKFSGIKPNMTKVEPIYET